MSLSASNKDRPPPAWRIDTPHHPRYMRLYSQITEFFEIAYKTAPFLKSFYRELKIEHGQFWKLPYRGWKLGSNYQLGSLLLHEFNKPGDGFLVAVSLVARQDVVVVAVNHEFIGLAQLLQLLSHPEALAGINL